MAKTTRIRVGKGLAEPGALGPEREKYEPGN